MKQNQQLTNAFVPLYVTFPTRFTCCRRIPSPLARLSDSSSFRALSNGSFVPNLKCNVKASTQAQLPVQLWTSEAGGQTGHWGEGEGATPGGEGQAFGKKGPHMLRLPSSL